MKLSVHTHKQTFINWSTVHEECVTDDYREITDKTERLLEVLKVW
jgi:hypothetical protein